MTPWQRLRTKIFLFSVGTMRRMTLGVRGVVIDGDKVFLVRHTYIPGWHFPGGGVEPGEAAATAVAREIFEETGLRVTGNAELFGFYHNTVVSDRDHVALFVYRDFETAKPFKANYEIADGGWFDRNNLPDDLAPGTGRRLAEIFEAAPKSATW